MKQGDVVRLNPSTPRSMVSKAYHQNLRKRVGSACGIVICIDASKNWVTVLFAKGTLNIFPSLLEVIIDYQDKTLASE
tara:strand:- start:85 stop:318 length:234 start_codon:yes stop_codon:yes gene_type:complete